MTKPIEDTALQQIAEFLPGAMETAVGSYKKFMDSEPGEIDAKNFKEQQEACKVAIAHIKLLVDLARLIASLQNMKNSSENEYEALSALIELGQRQVEEYEKNILT